MTTKITVNRFRIRKPDPVSAPPLPMPQPAVQAVVQSAAEVAPRIQTVQQAKPMRQLVPDDAFFPDEDDDGFGGQSFVKPAAQEPAPKPVQTVPSPIARSKDGNPGSEMEAIRREGLTGRQLRMARRLAQKHGLPATSDFDAVRLLRKAGIDPFQRSALLELVAGEDDFDLENEAVAANAAAPQAQAGKAAENSRALTVQPDRQRLPQTIKPAQLPSTEVRAEESHIGEVRRIQQELIARRRRKLALMWGKIGVFVMIPTFLAGWYYFMIATPMYSTQTQFVIQQSTPSASMSGLFSGTSFATSQDSVAVQGYLQSQDVMALLDEEGGFRAHFSDPSIDPLQRLEADANNSETYALYKKIVKISYDPTEGVTKMEVAATTPEKAVEFSNLLLKYAERRVDQLTERLRGDEEKSAAESFADAQAKLIEAQQHLVDLQQKYKTFNTEAEAGLITAQIGTLDSQLTQEKLALAQMEANARPNQARMDPVKRRIATLEEQIAELRIKLTESDANGPSIATVQGELLMAQGEVTTRQMMLSQATSAMETSRIEANRQSRYLSVAVSPVAPDNPTYPRAFENTLVVMLIFGGIYLMVSMTIAILREQISS